MAGCCGARGYDQIFGPRFARHAAQRYRRRGLDRATRRMVDFLVDHGIEGATVLEIGGGVGQLQVELLGRGAANAVNLELSAAYEDDATQLLHDFGFTGQVDRRLLDLAEDPNAVEPADVVILNRVVCCYPDYPRLLSAAASRARRLLVFSYPRGGAAAQTVVALQNMVFRVLGMQFRAFVHPETDMLKVLALHNMHLVSAHRGPIWQVAGLERRPHTASG